MAILFANNAKLVYRNPTLHIYREEMAMWYWLGPAILAVLAILAIVGVKVYQEFVIEPRAERKRQDAIRNDWLERIRDAPSDWALTNIGYFTHKDLANKDTAEANARVRIAQERVKKHDRKLENEFYIELEAAPIAQQHGILTGRPRALQSRYTDQKRLAAAKIRVMNAYVADLLERARSGDMNAFRKLLALTSHNHRYVRSKTEYSDWTGCQYSFPADWDELLCRLTREPLVSQFQNQKELAAPELLLLAEETLQTRDLVMAKYLFAYGSSGPDWFSLEMRRTYREGLGELMLNKLAELIVALHTEQGLFRARRSRLPAQR